MAVDKPFVYGIIVNSPLRNIAKCVCGVAPFASVVIWLKLRTKNAELDVFHTLSRSEIIIVTNAVMPGIKRKSVLSTLITTV